MIKNKAQLIKSCPQSRLLLELAEQALKFVEPNKLVNHNVSVKADKLYIQNKIFDLKKYHNIYVIGAGKATYEMAVAIHKLLKKRITAGYINVPVKKSKTIGKIVVNQAGHPHPTLNGVKGSQRIMQLLDQATKNDLVICLMSGGGSAMLPAPTKPLTLKDKINLTDKLLKCSANIHEINTIRKHTSDIKGGKLAELAMPAELISLYISDVIGDNLDMIASGPTVVDTTSNNDALNILKKYQIKNKKVIKIIKQNRTPKHLNKKKVHNFLIGNNKKLVEYLEIQIKKKKKNIIVKNLGSKIEGEAKIVANQLVNSAKQIGKKNKTSKKPIIILAGGETTVTVKHKGYGGRNQELVLAALPHLSENMVLLSLATDGIDGITPQPVAGAVAEKKLYDLCMKKKLSLDTYLSKNDSYSCLKKINSLLKIGPTGTNVGDIIMLLIN